MKNISKITVLMFPAQGTGHNFQTSGGVYEGKIQSDENVDENSEVE